MITRFMRINKPRTAAICFLVALWTGGVLVGCEESSNLIAPGTNEVGAPTQSLDDDEIIGEGVYPLPTADDQATTTGVIVAAAPTPAVPAGLGNALGDWVNIGRGEGYLGEDNVVGYVFERDWGTLNPVRGAEVRIHNRTKNIYETATTGRRGCFDVDIDAEPGDEVDFHIQWGNHSHTIRGRVTLR